MEDFHNGGLEKGLTAHLRPLCLPIVCFRLCWAAGGYQSLDLLKMNMGAQILPTSFGSRYVNRSHLGWLQSNWLLAYLNKHSLYIFQGIVRYSAF